MANRANKAKPKKSNLWQVIQSVLAAFFGVQSQAKFDHDAEQTDYKAYLIVALIMTLLLVLGLAFFVQWLVDYLTAGL